jgi:ubiquinone/menaquinone biosynthesis C-methylase UbiE
VIIPPLFFKNSFILPGNEEVGSYLKKTHQNFNPRIPKSKVNSIPNSIQLSTMFKLASSRSILACSRSFSSVNRSVTHEAAQKGFTESSSSSYEQGRPGYSAESCNIILETFWRNIGGRNTDPNKAINMVEIGAGTGKFTESFVSYFKMHEKGKLCLTAIEPSEGFRKMLAQKNIPGVKAVHGTGDAIPLDSEQVDSVLVAQAFHWMANTKTLSEIHRVLKPHAPFFMIWNTYNYEKEWIRIVDKEILTPNYGDVPRQQTEKWRECFFEEAGKDLFTPIHSSYHPYPFVGDRQMIINRFLSTSVIFQLPEEKRNKVVKRIEELIDNHPDFHESRITGKYEIPYTTHVAWVYAKK